MDLIYIMKISAVAIFTCLALLFVTDMFDIKNKTIYSILSKLVYVYCGGMAACMIGIYMGY